MRRPGHRADIQGLRGLAVLAVAAYHLDIGVRGGFLGVDVFFVVSGFVICTLLQRELTDTGRIDLAGFYGRRARRLLPALAVFVVVTVGLAILLTSPYDAQPFSFRTAGSALAFVANLYLYRHVGYFDGSAAQNPFLHLWSLSVEEQFYLGFPLLLLLGWRFGRRRGLSFAVAIGLAVSLALSFAMAHDAISFGLAAPGRLGYYASPTRAWELLAGALLALQWPRVARLGQRPAALMATVGFAAVLVEFAVVRSITADTAPIPLVTVAGTTLMLAGGARPGHVTRLLSARPLRTLGDWSYAWYLWHWPAIVFARVQMPDQRWVAVAAAVAALVPAWASTRFVETPIRLGPASPRSALRVAAVCTVVPVIAVAAGSAGAQRGWGVTVPLDWWATPGGRESGCTLFNRDIANDWPEEACSTTVDGQRGTVLILGDQNADSISPGAVAAANDLGYGTALWNRTDCPFSAATPIGYPRCAEWNEDALDLVERLRPAAVVVANQATEYVDPDDVSAIARADGGRPTSRREAVAIWRSGLRQLLADLRRRDIPVVLVGSVPDFEGQFPRERVSVLNPDVGSPSIVRPEFEASRRDVAAVDRELARADRDVVLVDPADSLCVPACAATDVDGRWWYYQGRYLNRFGGERLTEPMSRALRRALGLGSSG